MTPRKAKVDPEPADESPAALERTLPHNLEAEQAVLGAVFLHAETFDEIVSVVRPRHFFRRAHSRIFEVMQALVDQRRSVIDFVTVKAELARRGWLQDVGGPAYLTSLVNGMPARSHVAHYAAIVREAAMLRDLIAASTKAIGDSYDAKDRAFEIVQRMDRALVDLQRDHDRRGLEKHDGVALFEDLERRVANKGTLTGVETGYQSINELTLGWQAGDLVVLAARPSIGKTTFALNTAIAAAKTGTRVAFFSFEMRRLQLEYRMLASLSGVMLTKMLTGYLTTDEYTRIGDSFSMLDTLPIFITDRGGQNVWDIRQGCRRLRHEVGIELAVVDYVQLMPGQLDRRGATRNEEITDISRRMKELADELAIPVILLSQLSRAAEARFDPRPRLSDLRESGALEQDADIVVFLHRKNHREGGLTHCILEKQRNGPTGTVNLTLDRDITLFVDGGEEKPKTAEEIEQEKAERTRKALRRRAHAAR